MVTQKDVARMAGVSQPTVSLALKGNEGSVLPRATVNRVMSAVETLGYKPNRLAQALRTNQTNTIACLIPDITNPFYPSFVRGVQSAAEAYAYDVITVNTEGSRSRELHYLELALQGRVDGFVGSFFGISDQDIQTVEQMEVPIVRLEPSHKKIDSFWLDDVFVDNFSAMKKLTQFLINKGHIKIAIISGRGGPQNVRLSGYKAAMTGENLEPRMHIVDKFTEFDGYNASKAILKVSTHPTAIIAANDLMAIGVMRAINEANLRIPEDIAVAGFDNIPASQLVYPTLTTVERYQDRLGNLAVNLLMARLKSKEKFPRQVAEGDYKIIERNST